MTRKLLIRNAAKLRDELLIKFAHRVRRRPSDPECVDEQPHAKVGVAGADVRSFG